ncbi:MAG: hypothetical protein RIA65_07025 [Woeseia sp.]
MAEPHRTTVLALCCGLLVNAPIAAADELPEAELLDYLGSWAESDEDWVLLQNRNTTPAEPESEQSDSELTDDESQESKHER